MKTLISPLDVASDIHEVVTVYTDDPSWVRTEAMINECGDLAFECEITLNLNYDRAEASVGLQEGFEVDNVDVNIKHVYDDDGQEIKVPTYTLGKIEKLFEQNLTFEIYRR